MPGRAGPSAAGGARGVSQSQGVAGLPGSAGRFCFGLTDPVSCCSSAFPDARSAAAGRGCLRAATPPHRGRKAAWHGGDAGARWPRQSSPRRPWKRRLPTRRLCLSVSKKLQPADGSGLQPPHRRRARSSSVRARARRPCDAARFAATVAGAVNGGVGAQGQTVARGRASGLAGRFLPAAQPGLSPGGSICPSLKGWGGGSAACCAARGWRSRGASASPWLALPFRPLPPNVRARALRSAGHSFRLGGTVRGDAANVRVADTCAGVLGVAPAHPHGEPGPARCAAQGAAAPSANGLQGPSRPPGHLPLPGLPCRGRPQVNKALLTDAHKERFGVEESSKPYFVVIKVRMRSALGVRVALVRAGASANRATGQRLLHSPAGAHRSNKWCLGRLPGRTHRS